MWWRDVEMVVTRDATELAAWLHSRLLFGGSADPAKVRFRPEVGPDMTQPVQAEGWMGEEAEEILAANGPHGWWYSVLLLRLELYVYTPGRADRWIELGTGVQGAVVEGRLPGKPFVSVWEDLHERWLELAADAVFEAQHVAAAARGLEVAWKGNDGAGPRVDLMQGTLWPPSPHPREEFLGGC